MDNKTSHWKTPVPHTSIRLCLICVLACVLVTIEACGPRQEQTSERNTAAAPIKRPEPDAIIAYVPTGSPEEMRSRLDSIDDYMLRDNARDLLTAVAPLLASKELAPHEVLIQAYMKSEAVDCYFAGYAVEMPPSYVHRTAALITNTFDIALDRVAWAKTNDDHDIRIYYEVIRWVRNNFDSDKKDPFPRFTEK